MIVVDTNVFSELLRPRCNPAVTAWADAQPATSLFIDSIYAAELWAGVARLFGGGARRRAVPGRGHRGPEPVVVRAA